jgi:Tfp pilus assembly protein PilO
MKIENRQQLLIVLTVAAAALLVGVNFICQPLANLWSARAAQITELRTKAHDGRLLIQREAGIRRRWSDMNTNALPANTALAESQMLTALTTWSRQSGAEVTSIMPQWKNDSTNYMTLNCRVEASGTLGTLSQFLYNLEKGPMPLRLESVELSAHENTGQQLALGLQISGLVLLQPARK